MHLNSYLQHILLAGDMTVGDEGCLLYTDSQGPAVFEAVGGPHAFAPPPTSGTMVIGDDKMPPATRRPPIERRLLAGDP